MTVYLNVPHYFQRLLQTGNNQQLAPGAVRFAPGTIRPASVEQYEQLLQRQVALQARAVDSQISPRLPVSQIQPIQRPLINQQPTVPNAPTPNTETNTQSEQEIPDNVTAELEKLEQETGTMVELQGVSEILGGLGDDDDELLAEMGADFNILEYADPEALPGEKTNILDLELEEEPIKNDKKVKVEVSKPKAAGKGKPSPQVLKKEVAPTGIATTSQTSKPPPLAMSQTQGAHPPPTSTSHLTPQQIHQHMLHQVQQAAALGRPMAPGSKLQTPDGIIGTVTHNNNVQLQVPQSYHQRLLLQQCNIVFLTIYLDNSFVLIAVQNNHKLQMRLGQNVPRMVSVAGNQPALHPGPVGINQGPRMGVAAPPPPPPPYPGPPPPYPGSAPPQQQVFELIDFFVNSSMVFYSFIFLNVFHFNMLSFFICWHKWRHNLKSAVFNTL